MFSTFSGGRRYPGSISHRHKHVTFGKVAIGVAKGTAMIVIGVPVCTIAAGIGATAIVAYGLASPFYYGGKKLVKKIRRRVRKKEELECTDRLTREDILVWLENCEESRLLHQLVIDSSIQFADVSADEVHLIDAADSKFSSSVSGSALRLGAAASSTAANFGASQQRKKPALRRLFSRENRSGFLLLRGASSPTEVGGATAAAAAAADASSKIAADEGAIGGAYQARHLRQLTRAASMPSISQWQSHIPEALRTTLLSSLPQASLTVQKEALSESRVRQRRVAVSKRGARGRCCASKPVS
uniref:Transmembrane protein n=1 Tax=Macrostomum lignano TaxID=282301 RepID=A0A1I8JQ92_9PLAT